MAGTKIEFIDNNEARFRDEWDDRASAFIVGTPLGLVYMHVAAGEEFAALNVKQAKAIKKQLARAIRQAEANAEAIKQAEANAE